MKCIFIILFSFFLISEVNGQNIELDALVQEGMKLHEDGKFNEAIKKFEEALKINESYPMANYAMAVSCMALEMYNFATKYATIALVETTDDKLKKEIYILLGNVLDLRSLPYEAIEVYKEAILLYPDYFLIYFNLAITYLGVNDPENAESAVISSIKNNPYHLNSQLLLFNLNLRKNLLRETLLSAYFILMLEPNSPRAVEIKSIIDKILDYSKAERYSISVNNDNSVDIFISSDNIVEAMFEAFNQVKKEKIRNKTIHITISGNNQIYYPKENETKIETFINATRKIFESQHKFKKNNEFWNEVHLKTLKELINTNNLIPFCYYISQSQKTPEVLKWIEENQEKIDALRLWIDLNKE